MWKQSHKSFIHLLYILLLALTTINLNVHAEETYGDVSYDNYDYNNDNYYPTNPPYEFSVTEPENYSTEVTEWTLECKQIKRKELSCSDGELYVEKEQSSGWKLWLNILLCILIVLFAGLMSGLTMGLMSLDLMNLKIVQKSGSESARRHATKIMPLVEKHHLLLVTLLIGNSLAMEALPIFLDRIIGSIGAILMSVTMVLLFGEIIPQAICTRYGLAIGAHLSWLVWILIFVFFVIAYPVSKLLDWILGKETGTVYRRAELKELVCIHEDCSQDDDVGDSLSQEEANIIKQVLDFKIKTVEDVMTPLQSVSMVSYNDIIDIEYLKKLLSSGFSKWPVFMKKRDNVIGILTVQMVLDVNFSDGFPVSSLPLLRPPVIHQKLPLSDMLSVFQKGNHKIGLVVDSFDCITLLGIITITDLLKELLGRSVNVRENTFKNLSKAVKALSPKEKYSNESHSHHSLIKF